MLRSVQDNHRASVIGKEEANLQVQQLKEQFGSENQLLQDHYEAERKKIEADYAAS